MNHFSRSKYVREQLYARQSGGNLKRFTLSPDLRLRTYIRTCLNMFHKNGFIHKMLFEKN